MNKALKPSTPSNGSVRFETKVFVCIFVSSIGLCSVVALSCYFAMSRLVEEEFFERYTTTTSSLGNSIAEFERTAELNMNSGALFLKQLDETHGPLTNQELLNYREILNLTHIFVVDSKGFFIRSTNEAPSLIPNLFSFCAAYRGLINGASKQQVTPIIPPSPEPKPYKFLTIPNAARTRLIHVGLRVDFIENMLKRALAEDKNLLRLEISAPDGTSLGSFGRERFSYERQKDSQLSTLSDGKAKIAEGYVFSRWVDSAHVICCQCETSGNLRNGRYEYLIRAVVSDGSLVAAQSKIYYWMILIFVAGCLIAAFASRLLTAQLVGRLNRLTHQVKQLGNQSDKLLHVDVEGFDEISDLAATFNDLLHRYYLSQLDLLKVERSRAVSETATRVAHDIRSPISAINMVLASLDDLPNEKLKVLKDATSRVNEIAKDLLVKYKDTRIDRSIDSNLISLNTFVSRIYAELDVRLREYPGIKLKFVQSKSGEILCRVEETLLYRAINNCLNNAIEALPSGGELTLGLQHEGRSAAIIIIDNGHGIPAEILNKLGNEQISFGKENSISGAGIGLFSAKNSIEAMGGQLIIQSRAHEGTMVTIRFSTGTQAGADQVS